MSCWFSHGFGEQRDRGSYSYTGVVQPWDHLRARPFFSWLLFRSAFLACIRVSDKSGSRLEPDATGGFIPVNGVSGYLASVAPAVLQVLLGVQNSAGEDVRSELQPRTTGCLSLSLAL